MLRRHVLILLLAGLGAVGWLLAWNYVAPAVADGCSLCEYWEEQHHEETILEREEEESHETFTNRTLKITFEGWGAVEVHDMDGDLENPGCERESSYTSYCSFRIPVDHVALVTATPPAGTIFTGWEGLCSGTGACEVMMTGDREVTAGFIDTAPPLVPTIVTPTKGEIVQQAPDGGVVVDFNNSGDPGTRQFLCRLNTSDYRACTSPWTTRHLKSGPNTVRVKARDGAGNTSAPATRRFEVVS